MKKTIKKLLSCCLILLLTISSNAFAQDFNPGKDVLEVYEISEYDVIVSVKEGTYQTQERFRLSEDDIQFIRSGGVENELKHRASLSEEELKNKYFYSDDAIVLLKTYDGSPIEELPELRAVLATLNASLTKNFCISDAASVNYTWEWSTFPILMLTDDFVAVSWDATYVNGQSNNMQMVVETSNAMVRYYYTDTTYQTYYFAALSPNTYHGAYATFPMSNAFGNARSGVFRVTMGLVNTQNGPNLHHMTVHGEYRHTNPPLTVTVSFPVPLTISYTGLGTTYGQRTLSMYAS